MIWLLSAAVLGTSLGFSLVASIYVLTRIEWFLVRRKTDRTGKWVDRCFEEHATDPDAIHFADQTNVVHADFRPTRWPLPTPGDAA